ncbi:hypothetical protein V498_00873 [Pseudogymnoascus sp. VKM F-4517 (FW-2822)]|nr:hypothetical protein V498_00873 [Pseudogymnoascus sp. VKM F-4517 (FW-2822)]
MLFKNIFLVAASALLTVEASPASTQLFKRQDICHFTGGGPIGVPDGVCAGSNGHKHEDILTCHDQGVADRICGRDDVAPYVPSEFQTGSVPEATDTSTRTSSPVPTKASPTASADATTSPHMFETTARPSLGAEPTASLGEWRLGPRKFTGSVTVSKETFAVTRMPRFRVGSTPLLTLRNRDATVCQEDSLDRVTSVVVEI